MGEEGAKMKDGLVPVSDNSAWPGPGLLEHRRRFCERWNMGTCARGWDVSAASRGGENEPMGSR